MRLGTFHASGEAPPVGEHDEGKPLPIQVLDGLGCFEGGVGEPHLSRLLNDLQTDTSERRRHNPDTAQKLQSACSAESYLGLRV